MYAVLKRVGASCVIIFLLSACTDQDDENVASQKRALSIFQAEDHLFRYDFTIRKGDMPVGSNSNALVLLSDTTQVIKGVGASINFSLPSRPSEIYFRFLNERGIPSEMYFSNFRNIESRYVFDTNNEWVFHLGFDKEIETGIIAFELSVKYLEGKIVSDIVSGYLEVLDWGEYPDISGQWKCDSVVYSNPPENECEDDRVLRIIRYNQKLKAMELEISQDGEIAMEQVILSSPGSIFFGELDCELIVEKEEERSNMLFGKWAYSERENLISIIFLSRSNDGGLAYIDSPMLWNKISAKITLDQQQMILTFPSIVHSGQWFKYFLHQE